MFTEVLWLLTIQPLCTLPTNHIYQQQVISTGKLGWTPRWFRHHGRVKGLPPPLGNLAVCCGGAIAAHNMLGRGAICKIIVTAMACAITAHEPVAVLRVGELTRT